MAEWGHERQKSLHWDPAVEGNEQSSSWGLSWRNERGNWIRASWRAQISPQGRGEAEAEGMESWLQKH